MNYLTLENRKGDIVAKLYIRDNGNLHEDSWIRLKGWKYWKSEKEE